MTDEFDGIATNIKKEYEEVSVSETTVNVIDTELIDSIECNDITLYGTSILDTIKTEFPLFEDSNNNINGNGYIQGEAGINIKWLFCNNCCEEYKDYCTKCGMLEHVLNRNTIGYSYHEAKDGIPQDILEIRESLGSFGIFSLKVIPKGVKFGPLTGFCASEHTWRINKGKLVVSDDEIKFLNWMQYINSTENISEQNLLVLQYEGSLYYRSNRKIQKGEELLVCFTDKCGVSVSKGAEVEYNPAKDWEVKDVFACTFCCLGFSSKLYLSQHKTICSYKTNGIFIIEELMQCPSCKIYLEKKEYLEYHVAYCAIGNNNRQCVPSAPDLKTARLMTLSCTSKEQEKWQAVLYNCKLCKYKTAYETDLRKHVNNHYRDNMHRCEFCHRRFKDIETLRVHLLNVHVNSQEKPAEEHKCVKNHLCLCEGQKQCSCSKWKLDVKHKESLEGNIRTKYFESVKYECSDSKHKTNIEIKHNVQDYKCSECEYKSAYKASLEAHIRGEHINQKVYKCTQCEYETNYKSNLVAHKKGKHVEEKDYKCKECEYETNYKGNLKKHIKTRHLNEKGYKCLECEYECSCKGNLDAHIKAKHINEKNYKCTECEYKTSFKCNLEAHTKAKHVIEKYYKCAECEFETGYKGNLEAHIKVKHVNEEVYKCTECEYKTSYKQSLKRHIKAKHLRETYYKCTECEYEFNYKSTLQAHIKTKHLNENNYKCTECEYESCYKGNLENHIKAKHLNEKDYKCAECEYETSYKSNLETHIKAKHVKDSHYKCAECEYETSYKANLEAHLIGKHANAKYYKCTVCNHFKTSYKQSLKRHIKGKHRKGFVTMNFKSFV